MMRIRLPGGDLVREGLDRRQVAVVVGNEDEGLRRDEVLVSIEAEGEAIRPAVDDAYVTVAICDDRLGERQVELRLVAGLS